MNNGKRPITEWIRDVSALKPIDRPFAEDSRIALYPFTEEHEMVIYNLSKECPEISTYTFNAEVWNSSWNMFLKDSALYYAVVLKETDTFVGYVAIQYIYMIDWEIEIALHKEFRKQGLGSEALCLMLDTLKEAVGETHFRARVSPNNYASQALMKKIGAKPAGTSELLLHGAYLEQFRRENEILIDEKLEAVARAFQVAPIELLGSVLEYRIDR